VVYYNFNFDRLDEIKQKFWEVDNKYGNIFSNAYFVPMEQKKHGANALNH
jgi:hypothetical protein